ncbi:hypothetical protein DTO013E5_4240 [Penicillium roqueforti]|uniref:Genomic scaffold, ProqFM164S01 n=1 Tax=Penicillium roqueforti (strain FM164) TaxID=1365484 RepID=W6PTG2_PENRF|nr:hypothetical protein DTO012A1_6008 [Penicillium roqueforti]CDM27051.1 unnamed protein product [Penicillium roqueforti FM164]KAI2753884.1 hypothetical protein DTO013F2_2284 [Penicillium roqueforti]KAI2773539.1 hypothetical protein DTO012A8_1831 [Penicillium roqueforti]KAI3080756.1 hypothetical protein CBS147339_3342 [Penicillium roqueforti]
MVVKGNEVTDVTTKAKGRMDLEKPRRKGFVRWTIGLIVRLCIWYALLTPFFRCPTHLEDLTETSPRVCKPYLIARSHVEPYVTPYYDIYAAPYVDQARPYVKVFNQRVYTPASKFTKSGYEKYGAPTLKQAQAYGIEQWEHQVSPRLRTAQNKVHQVYLAKIDPHVQQSVDVVSPYCQWASTVVLNVYQGQLVPFYARSKPFIGKVYSTGQGILATHVMPGAQYTWSSAIYFANSSLWPHVTGLYSEQVEPQLVKIGQRLASYREGKRLRAVIEDVDSSSTVQPVSSLTTKSQEQIHTSTTMTSTFTPQASVQPTLTPTEQAQQVREEIDSDLWRWQERFSLAADKGIEDLEGRIGEIVSALVASSANTHGQSLSTALQSVSAEQISSMKQRINELAGSMPEVDAPEIEKSTSDLLIREIRTSAISVRDRAHALREWSISFEDELVRRVTAAVNSTIDVLDSIRNLGLQEIGMRWAWMDGVTYKDWAKYHALKAQLEEWRNDIRNVGMNHKSVSDARAVASDILDQGMHEAEQAARELVRLKDVGIWKIAAREVSDHFETRTEAPPTRPKAQEETEESDEEAAKMDFGNDESSEEVATPISDDAYEETPFTDEPSAAVNAEADFDGVNESVMDDDIVVENQPSARPAFGVAAADANLHQAPILDDESHNVQDSLASKVGDTYAGASDAVSEAVYGASTTNGVGEKVASLASEQYSVAWSAASTVIHGTPLSPVEKVYSDGSEKYSDAVAAASSVIYGTPTPVVQSLMDGASSTFADSTHQAKVLYEIAKSQVLSRIAESSAPVHVQILASIESAYSGSLKYATDELESKLRSVRATPTPSNVGPLAHISSIASSRLSHGLSLASEQLARVQPPATTASIPQGGLEPFVLDAQRRYYEAVGLAHDHYSVFVSTASEAVYGSPTPTPAGSSKGIIEEAGSQYEHVSSLVSASLAAVVASASSVMSSADGGKAQSIVEDASSRYNAALSAASSSLSVASISASSVIHGTSTGPVESLYSQVPEKWESLISKASEQIYGAPTPFLQQVVNNGRPQFEAVQGLVSELIAGKQPSYTESVLSKLRAAYETPYPAVAFSSASSYVNEAYGSASSVAASVISEAPSVEDIIQHANNQLRAAVETASVGIYGTPKGSYEKATDAAADAYSTASAQIISAVYGKESSYLDVAKDAIENIQSTASAAIYGKEPSAVESAAIRLARAKKDAMSQLADLAANLPASNVIFEAVETATAHLKDTTSSIKSSAVSVKDEL